MTSQTQAAASAAQTRLQIPLCDLGLAPENLRAAEPEDADVPRLAATIRAAGLIYPPIVRKGRRGEAPFMVLDGRRRRFALQRLAAEGAIPADHPVDCLLAADRAAQAAAAVLPNAEHAPVHLADVILAIGKLRRARLSTAAIAEALGYDEVEVGRLEAMAHVHPDVLQAFRLGKLTLRQLRLFARVKDRNRQGELAQNALGGYFHESSVLMLVTGGRVTVEDPRFALVSEADYAAAGGRLSADLFGELPAEVLDPDTLDACWRAVAAQRAGALTAEGLALSFARERGFGAPDGLEPAPFVHWGSLSEDRRAAFEAARERLESALEALDAAGPDPDDGAALGEVLRARLALARLTAGGGEVVAALLTPVRGGLDVSFYHRPAPETPQAGDDAEEDGAAHADDDLDEAESEAGEGGLEPRRREVEVPPLEIELSGVSHVQHAARTELATRGLARDLAEHPQAAIVVLTAHLLGQLALNPAMGPDASVLRIRAQGGVPGDDPDDGLSGEVWARLAAWRAAYLESGRRPIPFVASLTADRRTRLLVELTAVTVDLREPRTDLTRRAARAEAQEIAALCGADLARRWSPDAAFLGLHSRAQLLAFLADMAAEVPKADALRKDALVQAVAEAAAARRWVPPCLRWASPEPAEPAAAPEGDAVAADAAAGPPDAADAPAA